MDRYFTLEQAQELVPWLAETFREIAPVREQLASLTQEIDDLEARMRSNGGVKANERMVDARRELQGASELVAERVEAVTARGIVVRDVMRGLVDFPSLRERREVYLCWIEGETEIAFWHEVDTGFAGRQPL